MPRGRASLAPEASRFLQRARVLDATARVVAERGYAAATVQEIHGRAGVSRRTFYALFDGKSDAVQQGFDAAVRLGLPQILSAIRSEREPARAVDAALSTYLTLLDCDRDWAELCLIGVVEAGGPAPHRRDAVVAELVDALAATPEQRPAVLGALLAVDSEIRGLLPDRATELGRARTRLLRLAVAAVAGREAAERAVERAPAVVRLRASRAGSVADALRSDAATGARPELDRLVDEAVAVGDGPALWHAVLGFRERRARGLPVDGRLERRALDGLAQASFFGLPLGELAEGRSGALMPPSVRDRCLACVAARPGRSSAAIAAEIGPVHRSTVDRQLGWLEQAGLIRRDAGPGRAATWSATPMGIEILGRGQPPQRN